jgi:hypothetical protein
MASYMLSELPCHERYLRQDGPTVADCDETATITCIYVSRDDVITRRIGQSKAALL